MKLLQRLIARRAGLATARKRQEYLKRAGGDECCPHCDTWAKQPDLVVGHVVEVLYHEITPDGALREVRLSKKGIRHDKHPEQADGRLESRNE